MFNSRPYSCNNYPFRQFLAKQMERKSVLKVENQLLYNLQNPKARWFPLEMLRKQYDSVTVDEVMAWTEAELTECSRSVFIGETSNLRHFLPYLEKHYPSLGFYLAKELIFPVPFGVFFQTSSYSRVPTKLKNLIETGIYSQIADWFGRNRRSKLRISSQKIDLKKLGGITGNLQSIFYIYLILKLWAIISILFEIKLPCLQHLLPYLRLKLSNKFD